MNAAPMTSIGEAERRRLDPLSLPDPRAFSRWRACTLSLGVWPLAMGMNGQQWPFTTEPQGTPTTPQVE